MLLQTVSTAVGIFSIWLAPPSGDPVHSDLAGLVSGLATEFASAGARNFTPHVTVLQDIQVDPIEAQGPLLAKLHEVAGTIEPFSLTFTADPVHATVEWSQSLVAYLAADAKLTAAHKKVTAAFNGPRASTAWAAPSAHPHVSLMLAPLTAPGRVAAKARALAMAPWLSQQRSFPVEELQLWLTGPKLWNVPTWTLVGIYPLKGVASKRLASKKAKAA